MCKTSVRCCSSPVNRPPVSLLPFPQGRVTSQAQPSAFALSCLSGAIKMVGVTVSLPPSMDHRRTHKHDGRRRPSGFSSDQNMSSSLSAPSAAAAPPHPAVQLFIAGHPEERDSHFYCVNLYEGGREAAASTSRASRPGDGARQQIRA